MNELQQVGTLHVSGTWGIVDPLPSAIYKIKKNLPVATNISHSATTLLWSTPRTAPRTVAVTIIIARWRNVRAVEPKRWDVPRTTTHAFDVAPDNPDEPDWHSALFACICGISMSTPSLLTALGITLGNAVASCELRVLVCVAR